MKITVMGRGNVGGGLARRWEAAGHQVKALGRDGGDASGSDVVVVAVPSGSIDTSFDKVTGIEGQVAIDATNAFHGRAEGFESLAHQVKAHTHGPVSKAFNTDFASLYGEIDDQRARPSGLYCGDEEARAATEQLIRDAGFEPVRIGDLGQARALEDFLAVLMGIAGSGMGQTFHRFAPPGKL